MLEPMLCLSKAWAKTDMQPRSFVVTSIQRLHSVLNSGIALCTIPNHGRDDAWKEASPEQKKTLTMGLATQTVQALEWVSWDQSAARLEKSWPFVRSALGIACVWTQEEHSQRLRDVAEAGNTAIAGRE